MQWVKRYRMRRMELVKYHGESVVVPMKNSADGVRELYR